MDELGLLDEFLQRPHQRLEVIGGWFGDQHVQLGDFRGLPARYAFIAMMPQWEFLDFLADEAKKLPTFTLRMRADVTGLIEEGGRVVGVRGTLARRRLRGPRRAHRRLRRPPLDRARRRRARRSRTSARRSTCSGFASRAIRPSSTTAWRGSRPATSSSPSTAATTGSARSSSPRAAPRRCASGRSRNSAPQVVAAGPVLAAHIGDDVRSWDDVKLLTVAVDRLTQWSKPGLLCIGDAAHAMSPIGGVGINLAIQDAVAAANLLAVEAARRHARRRRPRRGAGAPPLADQGDAGGAGRHPEQRPRAGA